MRDYILFRFVPTMRCNYRCNYCFLSQDEKKGPTMFDRFSPADWVEGMKKWAGHDVQFYCWGGEPFLLDGTYEVVKGWTGMDHVKSGCRLDTNMHFADKIADRCPTSKVKLNCSWHTQYDSLEEIFRKAARLRNLDMVGMLNFVASPQNLNILTEKYRLSVQDLIRKFKDAGIFVNIAADFNLVNQPVNGLDNGYKQFVQSFVTPEDWRQLRSEKKEAACLANHHFFTVHHNGDITPCLGQQVCGNFFEGTLVKPPLAACGNDCPSIVAYPFRMDNAFPIRNHLCEYVARCASLREPSNEAMASLPSFMPIEAGADYSVQEEPANEEGTCATPQFKRFRIPPVKLDGLPPIAIESGSGSCQETDMKRLAGKIAFLARYFDKILLKETQNIAVMYPVGPMFFVVWLALLKAGKTPCLLEASADAADLNPTMVDAAAGGGIDAIVCAKDSIARNGVLLQVGLCGLEWNLDSLGSIDEANNEIGGDCMCPVSSENTIAFLEDLCRQIQNPGMSIRLKAGKRPALNNTDGEALPKPGCSAVSTSTNAPLVSVVLPVYNHRRLLPLAVESMLAQTMPHFELIIVNDGSTDGTREYLEGLTDPRISVIHQENRRLPGALNAGFRQAKGKYCTWVSADNFSAPLFLEALAAALEKNTDAGWAVSAFAWINEQGDIQGVHKDQDLSVSSLLKSNPGIASFLYRRDLAEKIGAYDEALEGAEDWDFWLRLAEISKPVYVPEVLYYYRLHADSMTEKKRALIKTSSRRVIENFLERHNGQLDLAVVFPGLNGCANKSLAEFHACLHLGVNLLSSSFAPHSIAAQLLEQAFDMNPTVEVLVNLCAALAVAEKWAAAQECLVHLDRLASPLAAPALPSLRQAVEHRNGQLARQTGLFRLDPTQSELLRMEKERQAIYFLTLQA